MIQPNFSDSHKAFEEFCKVTDPQHFLRANASMPPLWRQYTAFAALPVTIWIVHFFIPLSVVRFLVFSQDITASWIVWIFIGQCIWLIVFFFPAQWFFSQQIKRILREKGIAIKGWHWFGPEVAQLMRQEFTLYLACKGFCNSEALGQLINDTRDDIERIWRPMPVILTLTTLAIAVAIAYYQPVFGQAIAHATSTELLQLALGGIVIAIPVVIYGWVFYTEVFSAFRMKRSTYLQCLSHIRLSVIKSRQAENTKPDVARSNFSPQVSKQVAFSLYCEFRHPFSKGSRFIFLQL
jgi:hypothetical protein